MIGHVVSKNYDYTIVYYLAIFSFEAKRNRTLDSFRDKEIDMKWLAIN